jgi:hypothetical protein
MKVAKRILQRVALFVFYGMLSYGVIWLFGAGGEGSLLPAMVFSSWAIPLTRLVWPPNGAPIFLVTYYVFLFGFNTMLSRSGRGPSSTWVVHFSGVLIGLIVGWKHEPPHFFLSCISFIFSSLLAVLYIWVDWRLAKDAHVKDLDGGIRMPRA